MSYFLFVPEHETSNNGASMVTGTLHVVASNGSTIASYDNVVTGGHGNGAIEGASHSDGDLYGTNVDHYSARYDIEYYQFDPNTLPGNMMTKDNSGTVGFAIGIADQHGRTDLAIHPDNVNNGGSLGTLGCLGIPDEQARHFKNTMYNLRVAGDAPTSLYIVDPSQARLYSAVEESQEVIASLNDAGVLQAIDADVVQNVPYSEAMQEQRSSAIDLA